MVLGADREAVVLGVLRHSLWQRPGSKDSVSLEPQVPVEPPRVVLVDHEAVALRLGALAPATVPRLGRLVEGPLPLVLGRSPIRHPLPW